MSSTLAYKQAWRSLRLRRLAVAALFFGYLPGVATIALSAGNTETIALVTALIWMGLFGLAAGWLSVFRCPRCGNLFGVSWTWSNPLARRCLHCGLSTGSPADPAEPSSQP